MSYKTDPENENIQYNPEYPDTFWTGHGDLADY